MPRFAVHRFRNAAPADRRRRTHGPTGRIHHPGLSCGQTRPLAGRSRGRHHRLVLAGVARARRQPDARGLFRSVRHPARKTAAPHLAAGTRTRLLGRGGRIRRPHPAARHHAADQGADRRPAQLVFARQRHQGGSRRSHRRSAERRKKHLAQPPAQRRTGHGLGHRRHDARRHRRARQHRRDRFPVPRHGRHPQHERHPRTNGNRPHHVEHRTGADHHPPDRRIAARRTRIRRKPFIRTNGPEVRPCSCERRFGRRHPKPELSAPSRPNAADGIQQNRQNAPIRTSRRRRRHLGTQRRRHRRPAPDPARRGRYGSALPRRHGHLQQPPLRSPDVGVRSPERRPRRPARQPSDRPAERRDPSGHPPSERRHRAGHRPGRGPQNHILEVLHRQVGYCNQLQRIRTNYNEVADFQRLFYLPKIQL